MAIGASPLVRIALDELERQLKETALYYQRYGKGRDRLIRLQWQYRQYWQAVHQTPSAEQEDAAPRLLSAA